MCQVPCKHPYFKSCNYPAQSTWLVCFYTEKEIKAGRGEVTRKPAVSSRSLTLVLYTRQPPSLPLFLVARRYHPPLFLSPVLKGGFTKDGISLFLVTRQLPLTGVFTECGHVWMIVAWWHLWLEGATLACLLKFQSFISLAILRFLLDMMRCHFPLPS